MRSWWQSDNAKWVVVMFTAITFTAGVLKARNEDMSLVHENAVHAEDNTTKIISQVSRCDRARTTMKQEMDRRFERIDGRLTRIWDRMGEQSETLNQIVGKLNAK